MVFGWGKKHKVETVTQKEIFIQDIRDLVADLKDRRMLQTVSDVQRISNVVKPLLKQLIDIANHLDRDDLKIDDVDKNVGVLVKRGKKQLIGVIRKDVSVIDDIVTADDAFAASRTLGLILKKLGDVLGRQTRVIHLFAKKYANQLKHNLEDLKLHNTEIEQILNNYSRTQDDAERIVSILDKIQGHDEFISKTSDRISEIRIEIKRHITNVDELETKIQREKESEEHSRYLSLCKSHELLDSQKSNIRNVINSQFTKISRPLGRYEYGSSLEKTQRPVLEQLVKDPFTIMTINNKDDIIIILGNVKKGIESGSISVKDIAKSLSYMDETVSLLDKFISQVSEIEERYNKIERDMRSCNLDTLHKLESDLRKSESSASDLKNKQVLYSKEIEVNSQLRKELLSELESTLRRFSSTNYIIVEK